MSTLIIAEKPSLAEDILEALPGRSERKRGYTLNGEYIVTNVFGHMLGLKMPDEYDEKYKRWNLEDLPIYFQDWEVRVDPAEYKKERVDLIGELLKDADTVIHAGDPDDEGQLLIDEILRFFGYKGKILRLNCADTTKEALIREMGRVKDNKEFELMGWAAYARSVADIIVGVNLSRLFSVAASRSIHVGRVQTPTLGLVVQRDRIRASHKKIIYYEYFVDVMVKGEPVRTKFTPFSEEDLMDGKVLDPSFYDEVRKSIPKKADTKVSKKEVIQNPPLPFNLLELQNYMGKHYRYSPAEVMRITQTLREKQKAITYNRSDCRYLSEAHLAHAPETMDAIGNNLGGLPNGVDLSRKSAAFNDGKITAHHAIIPTTTRVDLSGLTKPERLCYEAIASYYIAQFLPPAVKEKTEMTWETKMGSFKATSTKITHPGFLSFLKGKEEAEDDESEEETESVLSLLPPGNQILTVGEDHVEEKETKPPGAYTQTSLNADMARIAKYVEDPQIKRILISKDDGKKGENGSIGTPATRSEIITKLLSKGYISEDDKGKLSATELGRTMYEMLPDEIKTADMTAKWWSVQEDIKEGSAAPQNLIDSVLSTVSQIISEVKADPESYSRKVFGGDRKEYLIIGECPKCGHPVRGYSKAYSCSSKDCDFVIWKTIASKSISESTAKMLLEKRKTKLLRGFKSKKGNSFDAFLVLKGDYSIGFEFPDRPREHPGR